MYRIRKILWK